MDEQKKSLIRQLFGEQRVSYYRSAKDNAGSVVRMSAFLLSESHAADVATVRRLKAEGHRKECKDYKASHLPSATLSGWFMPTRSKENLHRHSGYICMDFDADDNPDCTVDDMYDCLSAQPEVQYAALSCSGTGMYALIPVDGAAIRQDLRLQGLLFRALLEKYSRVGLIADRACGDVCRLRFVSHDDDPLVRAEADVWTTVYQEPLADANRYVPQGGYTCSEDFRNHVKLAACLELISALSIDIVEEYNDWARMAMALREFGEEGRLAFHTISAVSPCYSSAECDRKWRQCQQAPQTGEQPVRPATFFNRCKQFGIRYADATVWKTTFPRRGTSQGD